MAAPVEQLRPMRWFAVVNGRCEDVGVPDARAAAAGSYGLDGLGWLQFERLVGLVLSVEAQPDALDWSGRAEGEVPGGAMCQ